MEEPVIGKVTFDKRTHFLDHYIWQVRRCGGRFQPWHKAVVLHAKYWYIYKDHWWERHFHKLQCKRGQHQFTTWWQRGESNTSCYWCDTKPIE